MSTEQECIDELEDLFHLLIKTESNYKKCPKVRKTKGYLSAKIKCIEEYWASFRSAHQQLIKLTTKDARATLKYFEEDIHGQCEEVYTCLKADLMDSLPSSNTNEMSTILHNTSTSSDRSEKTIPDVRLPRINLPTFSGTYEEWQSFEDTFVSLIHTNKGLSDVQKLHYLKSCVVGEASNTIKHFQVTEKNYLPAWDNLKGRYSQKRLIVNAILKRLFSLKKVTVQSPTQLKTLIDNTKECLTSLNSLNIFTGTWDPIIIFLVIQKLDQESHKAWESYVSGEFYEEMPTFNNLTTFLENRICTLELTTPTTPSRIKERSFHAAAPLPRSCIMCNENHLLCHCKQFGSLDPDKRSIYIKEQRLCYNCLAAGHPVIHCKQKSSCRICGKRHHSLLHSYKKRGGFVDNEKKKITPGPSTLHTNVEENQQDNQDVLIASHFISKHKRALLATALVPIRNASGQVTILRALIDPGSQASFISERATQMLKLRKTSINGTVTGVGSSKTSVRYVVNLEVLSRCECNFSLDVKAYVLSTPYLTTNLPCKSIQPRNWSHLDGLTLADPNYNTPGKIDLLLGVDVYTDILKGNLVKGPPGTPCAQETNLGWILFGNIDDQKIEDPVVMHIHLDVDNMLRNMWDIETTNKRSLTTEEKLCEDIYVKSHSRTPDGRYVVKLPFKSEDPIQLVGETRDIALYRFHKYEKRLEKNPKLKEACDKVIEEYLQLEHMEEVPEEDKDNPAIYLPYHPVIREGKETTSVRLVFDASCVGTNNQSLNDQLLVGPQLQEDLRDLIMRWRMKSTAFVSDVEKMYRQILVTREDTDYQRILWRKSEAEDIKEYRLLRVTFGVSSAPYLAVRTLMQLAEDEGKTHAAAAKVIKEDFFVDDCISGCIENSEDRAIEISKNLTQILEKGGFVLQKWASNTKSYF